MRDALMITGKDNVATSLQDVKKGDDVSVRLGKERIPIQAAENIPFGFKMAVHDIAKGSEVIKYGESIGIASRDITRGQMVHVHNIEGKRGRGDLEKGR